VRVSVVIPTYRRPKELERAVNSVLNNGYEDVEVLIGYDGEKYGEFKDERVKTFGDCSFYSIQASVQNLL
jgi:glycosyltransferase involved in cell wall biosynthesis